MIIVVLVLIVATALGSYFVIALLLNTFHDSGTTFYDLGRLASLAVSSAIDGRLLSLTFLIHFPAASQYLVCVLPHDIVCCTENHDFLACLSVFPSQFTRGISIANPDYFRTSAV